MKGFFSSYFSKSVFLPPTLSGSLKNTKKGKMSPLPGANLLKRLPNRFNLCVHRIEIERKYVLTVGGCAQIFPTEAQRSQRKNYYSQALMNS